MGLELTVILVDDDPDFLDLGAKLLERANPRLTVLSETEPERVLNRLKLRDISCVVSDYDMPGMNGLELLRKVREEFPRLPFILFTGKGSEDVASKAVNLDVTGYQQKEYGSEQFQMLANTIEKAVDGYRARSMANQKERQLLRYKQAVEHSEDLIAAIDLQKEYIFVNEAFLQYHGLDREDVEGHAVDDVLSPQTVERIAPHIDEAFSGKTVNFQFSHKPPGGDQRYYDISYFPLRDPTGRIEGLVSEMRDITHVQHDNVTGASQI